MKSKAKIRSDAGIYGQALQLVAALEAETGGKFQHWRSVGSLSESSTDALQLAVDRGWLLLRGAQRLPDR
jgi:hypothetical protein